MNRDGFVWEYTQIVGKIVNKIVMEKENYGKVYNQRTRWRGKNRNFTIEEISRPFEDAAFKLAESQALAKSIAETIEALKTTDPEASRAVIRDRMTNAVSKTADELGMDEEKAKLALAALDDFVCDYYADFIIHVRGKGFDKIPEHLTPAKMGKAYVRLAKLWKRCVKIALEAADIRADYCIGWVLDRDEKVYATHSKVDEVHTFLLNPLLTWMDSSNHMHVFHEMLLTACHEVAHVRYPHHDESFTLAFHSITHRALCAVNGKNNSWWKEFTSCKEETL